MQLGEVGVAWSCAESRGLDPLLVPGECGGPWGSMFPQRAVWSPTVTSLATLCSILFFWQKEGKKEKKTQHSQPHENVFTPDPPPVHFAEVTSSLNTVYSLEGGESGGKIEECALFFVFFFPQLQFLYILTYFPPYQYVRSSRMEHKGAQTVT